MVLSLRKISLRIKEHQRHLRNGEDNKSAVAEHILNKKHTIDFNKTKYLGDTKIFYSRLIKESIEIHKHPNNFNRDDGFKLHNAWKDTLKFHSPEVNHQARGNPLTVPGDSHQQTSLPMSP